MFKVSIIIPNYNHAKYLQQRIESVLNQTYRDFEVIILDDCSTDNSKKVIESFRNNEIISHIIYNEANSGSSFKQWHKGIQLAKGEYIWIAESDDWCERNFLETIVTGLENNKDAVFGYCQSFCVSDEGNIIFQSNHIRLEEYCPKEKFLESFLCFRNAVFNASMAVFRKKYYSQVSNTFQSFKFTGDWIFWAELSRLGDVYINAKPLNYFRKHALDVSGKMYASGKNFIEEINMLEYFNKHLHLNNALFNKAKLMLYRKFISGKKKIEPKIKKQVNNLFFHNVSFLQKQYFLLKGKSGSLKDSFVKSLTGAYRLLKLNA